MKKDNLHNIKSSGFKIPDNYFESFESNFLERLKDKESISAPKKPGFKVPDNYFESLETNVFCQLQNKPQKTVIALNPRRTFYYVAGIAASIILLLSLVFNNNDRFNIDAIDTASIESYLYQEDFSNEDLATLFNNNELSDTDFIKINISDDVINDYLENTDIEDLIID